LGHGNEPGRILAVGQTIKASAFKSRRQCHRQYKEETEYPGFLGRNKAKGIL